MPQGSRELPRIRHFFLLPLSDQPKRHPNGCRLVVERGERKSNCTKIHYEFLRKSSVRSESLRSINNALIIFASRASHDLFTRDLARHCIKISKKDSRFCGCQSGIRLRFRKRDPGFSRDRFGSVLFCEDRLCGVRADIFEEYFG